MNVNSTLASMSSPSQVLEKLKEKGMDNELHWTVEGLSAAGGKKYQPQELEIIKTFRFEGASDPGDSEVLYLIRAKDGLVGYLQDAYGAETDHHDEIGYNNFIRQIPIAGHDEEMLFTL